MAAHDSFTVREQDHVRRHSRDWVNQRIDLETEESVSRVGSTGGAAIDKRIDELDREWDVERWLMANAATIAGASVLLAAFHSRKWLVLTGAVSTFLLQHSIQGWCPPLTIFRALGIRTRKEIDREKFALKAVRGDFATVTQATEIPAREFMDAATR